MNVHTPDEPELTLRPAFLAYVDVMGMRQRLKEGATRDVLVALGTFRAMVVGLEERKADRAKEAKHGQTLQMATFSDCIALSCPPIPEETGWLVFELQVMCQFLVKVGFYPRGAITVGGLYHEGTFLIGPSLVEAHGLEQNVSKYPRIVVADSAATLAHLPSVEGDGRPGPLQTRVDLDGIRYLSIYPQGLTEGKLAQPKERATAAKEAIQARRANQKSPERPQSAVEAMGTLGRDTWMLRYLDSVIEAASASTED
ncbi:MAG TPA: hypothetical protein VHO67_04775 [Polyangia bacterium]|nr:hypothetical protein [Polyangia bacterium]